MSSPDLRSARGSLMVVGYLALLSGLGLVMAVLGGSRSVDPAVFGRYSVSLALANLILAVAVLALAALSLPSPVRLPKRLAGLFDRVAGLPAFLELTIALGWAPPAFLALAGAGLTPLAGEPLFMAGLWTLYGGWILLAVSSVDGSRRRTMLERLAALAAGSVVGLLGLELALRLIAPGSVFTPSLELRPHLRLVIDVDLPGMSPRISHSTNRWGMRGEEPPEDWDDWFTIVTIGGSTTHCYYLDDSLTWPHLLQEHLRDSFPRTWVGNGGLSGHTTRGHIVFMREVIAEIKPDMVVLLIGTNDLAYSTRPNLVREAIEAEKVALDHRIIASSRLLQVLYLWFRGNFGETHMMHENPPIYVPQPMELQEVERPDDLREMVPTLEEYAENIRTIIRLGREEGVQVVFMTQPSLWNDTPYWRGIRESHYWTETDSTRMSAATTWRLLEVLNHELISICRREDVPCLDLASLLPHSTRYFYDGMHYNEAGAARVARLLADFLEEEGLVPVP